MVRYFDPAMKHHAAHERGRCIIASSDDYEEIVEFAKSEVERTRMTIVVLSQSAVYVAETKAVKKETTV